MQEIIFTATFITMVREANTQGRLLLPAILTIALLFAALGVRGLDISRPLAPKPRPRAVIESQIKVVEEQLAKTFQTADLCSPPTIEPPSGSHRLYSQQSTATHSTATVAATPSRAPPLL